MIRQTVVSAVLAALTLSAAWAQSPTAGDPDCVLDRCRQARPAAAPSNVATGAFDFYVLALSWSPSFCASNPGRSGEEQCRTDAHRGFVVHGLWPQFTRGFPSNCDPSAPSPSRAALDIAAGVYPDLGLARHEWRTHGTCTGQSPTAYFGDVKRARDSVSVPAAMAASRATPADIQRAFLDANPRLRPGMLAVTCQRGVLAEVRVCLSKDLRGFQVCPEVARAGCRSSSISVPAVP